MLLGGCAEGAASESWLLGLATSPAASAAGKYSFHMYLLQELVAKAVLYAQAYSDRQCDGDWGACSTFVAQSLFHRAGVIRSHFWLLYLGALLGIGAAWFHRIEEPWVRWLRAKLEQRLQPPIVRLL